MGPPPPAKSLAVPVTPVISLQLELLISVLWTLYVMHLVHKSPPPLIPLIQNVPTAPLVKVQKSMVVYVLRQLLPHLLLQLPHLDLLLLLHLPLLLLLHLLEELLLATPPQLDLHLLSWLFLLLLDFKSTTTKNILCLFPIKFFLAKEIQII